MKTKHQLKAIADIAELFGATMEHHKTGGGHVQILFTFRQRCRKIYIGHTCSDWRAAINNLSLARRVLRDLTGFDQRAR
jgi:hypothetical protein